MKRKSVGLGNTKTVDVAGIDHFGFSYVWHGFYQLGSGPIAYDY